MGLTINNSMNQVLSCPCNFCLMFIHWDATWLLDFRPEEGVDAFSRMCKQLSPHGSVQATCIREIWDAASLMVRGWQVAASSHEHQHAKLE